MRTSDEVRQCRDCERVLPVKKFKKIGAQGYRRHRCTRCYDMKYVYGITGKEFNRMLEEQMYCCLICEDPITESTANVDHCHTHKNVRALLCKHCNIAIGHLRHSQEVASRAVEYLIKHI